MSDKIAEERNWYALRYHALLRDYRALLVMLYRGTPKITAQMLDGMKRSLDDNDINGAQPWPKR